MQRTAAGADEDEAGGHRLGRASDDLLEVEAPGAVLLPGDVGDLAAGVERAAVGDDVVEQLVGQRAEVDVGAGRHARRRVGAAAGGTLLHQQGRPLVDGLDAR